MSTRLQSWRCAACGEVFTAYARWERHADQLGHHRMEIVMSPSPKGTTDDASQG